MKKRKIDFYRHSLDNECLTLLNETARGIFLTTGPRTSEFENALSGYLNLPCTVGTMSCTHSLHLSYLALGIGPGDEVIVPAYTFVASVTAIIHAGASPVLVEVDPDTGLIDPDAVEAAITPKTRGICPVHLYGVMAPMDKLAVIANKHGLKIIEDAAHCIEGRGPGFGPGTLSDAVAFSFYATKNITSGEGGAVGTRHEDISEALKRLRNHGMTKSAMDRFSSGIATYDVREIGYKANMNDLQASLLLPQLAKIEELLARREEIASLYNAGLSGIDGIKIPPIPDGYRSARHLYTIHVSPADEREKFMTALIAEGIGCSINYRPLSSFTYFNETLGIKPEDHPNATKIGNSTVTLPLYPSLSNEEVGYVVEAVRKAASETLA